VVVEAVAEAGELVEVPVKFFIKFVILEFAPDVDILYIYII
jgi:hypothetical protein